MLELPVAVTSIVVEVTSGAADRGCRDEQHFAAAEAAVGGDSRQLAVGGGIVRRARRRGRAVRARRLAPSGSAIGEGERAV
jgi:hypothetical protein